MFETNVEQFDISLWCRVLGLQERVGRGGFSTLKLQLDCWDSGQE